MEIRASLPKTPVGKLSKKELLAEEIAKRRGLVELPWPRDKANEAHAPASLPSGAPVNPARNP